MAPATRPHPLQRLMTIGLCALLNACQSPVTSPGATTPHPSTDLRAIEPASVVRDEVSDSAVRGRVDIPGLFQVQAAPDYAASGATLTLVSLSDNMTVVTGRTNTDGSFVLPINGYTPAPNSYYLLESSHGLNNHAAGNQVARFRTFLKWTGTAWTSVSGSPIVINPQTTAVAIISSLDSLNVPPSSTMGKVSGSSINGSPALTGHADGEISALAAAVSACVTNDLDPVQNTPGLKPSVSTLRPVNPYAGAALMIQGNGFSPIPTANTVLFATATASVFSASPTTLGVFVPNNAPASGIVTVRTSMGVSTDNAAYSLSVASSGGGSGGGGSGGGGSSGLSIASLTPPNGAPGDTIMIRGTGFSSVITDNVVKFSGVSATVSYADGETLIVAVPNGAMSGPLTVTVGGVTKGFFFNFTVPIISDFSPNTGNQGTSVTVNGQNFGTQGPQSKIRFNGFPSPNITSWFGTQAVGLAPGPSLTNRITGPVTVITDSGIVSQTGGTFTARQNVVEDFSTTNQKNASTSAAWGSGALSPAAAATTFTQSGTGFGSNTNANVSASSSGLSLASNWIRHTGVLPTYPLYFQLGADNTSYFISNGSGTPTIYRYSLADGSQLGTSSRSGVSGLIYDRTNNCYVSCDYSGYYNVRRYTNWNDTAYTANFYCGYSPWVAANGTKYFVTYDVYDPTYDTDDYYNIMDLNGNLQSMWEIPASAYSSAAGFAGGSSFLFNGGSNSLSSLRSYSLPNGTQGTVTLPFTIAGPTGGSYAYPLIGSDGVNLFVLGTNASYNGGANTLFRFAVSGTSATPVIYSTSATGTSVTSAISLPTNAIWDAVNFSVTKPAGTAITVDVLDGATNAVLKSNVTNGQSLNGVTAASLKLKVTMSTTDVMQTPVLTSWSVMTRGSYALSSGYDTGTNFGQYEAPAITANNANYVIQYSDSADNSAWSAWTNNITTLSRRYVRYQINFTASNAQITRINLPYTY